MKRKKGPLNSDFGDSGRMFEVWVNVKRKKEKKVDRGGEKKKRAQNLNKSLTYNGVWQFDEKNSIWPDPEMEMLFWFHEKIGIAFFFKFQISK